eukprot:scaffold8587_cov97-Cylindrotheca_fusiformis.AAC.2
MRSLAILIAAVGGLANIEAFPGASVATTTTKNKVSTILHPRRTTSLYSAHRAGQRKKKSAYSDTQVVDREDPPRRMVDLSEPRPSYPSAFPVDPATIPSTAGGLSFPAPAGGDGGVSQRPWYEENAHRRRSSSYTPAFPIVPMMEPPREGDVWFENQSRIPSITTRGGGLRHDGRLTEYPSSALLHGNSRRTWHSNDPYAQTSEVLIQSERPRAPLYANVSFRNGPSNTPRKMRVYSEDGYLRPVRAYFSNPKGGSRAYSNMVDIMNTASMEFPISATVSHSRDFGSQGRSFQGEMDWKTIQGDNCIRTYTIEAGTRFVKVNLESDGSMPLMANVEVLEGPGDVRQLIEVQSDDGSPWEGVIAIPAGYPASIIVRNVGPMAFPIRSSVESQV